MMNFRKEVSFAILVASSLTATGQQPGANQAPQANSPVAPGAQFPVVPSTAVTPPSPQSLPETKAPSASEAAPKATPGTPAAGVDNATYIIGPEDALQVTVWREPTLSGTFPVRPDGKISMVLLGDLPAAGITPTKLSEDIGQRLHKYVQDPSVTVQVMAVNSQRIYMIGEVGHVGPINLSAAMTPLQAIATAGGLSPFANSKHIYILRGVGSAQQKIPYNYKQALKGDDRQQIVLRPGDTIVVP